MYRYEGHSQKDRNGHVYSQDKIKDACGFWVIGVSPAAWAKVYRTEFLKKNQLLFPVGLFYEDFPFYWSCISYARRIALASKVLYNYRIRDDSIMGISKTKKPGMAIHHLYGLQKIYIEWERNVFLKTNKSLFRYLFEFYVEVGWKYLHSDDQEEFVAKVLKCSKEWMVHPRRFTLADVGLEKWTSRFVKEIRKRSTYCQLGFVS